jgi:hypothetical protein
MAGLIEKKLPEIDFVYKDVCSMENLYKHIYSWLEEEGYINAPNSDDEKWMETNYVEKIGNSGAREIWILWRTRKEESPYFRFVMNVDYHVLGMVQKEIMHEGKKITLDYGEIEIWIKPTLIFDPEGKWEKQFLIKNKMFMEFLKKRYFKKEVDQKEELLQKDQRRLFDSIKNHLDLKVFLKEYKGESFKPQKGIGM